MLLLPNLTHVESANIHEEGQLLKSSQQALVSCMTMMMMFDSALQNSMCFVFKVILNTCIVMLQLEENQAEIRNMLTYIFKGVFVHRYRYGLSI